MAIWYDAFTITNYIVCAILAVGIFAFAYIMSHRPKDQSVYVARMVRCECGAIVSINYVCHGSYSDDITVDWEAEKSRKKEELDRWLV